MSCIAWNCRGLGNHLAVQELAEVVTTKAPVVVFLAETLADEARLDYVKDRICFDKKFVVQRVHRRGDFGSASKAFDRASLVGIAFYRINLK